MPMITPHDAAAIFLAVLVMGVTAIYAWMGRKERQARDQAAARARAALASKPGSTFDEGANAAIDGLEFWRNPYCTPGQSYERSHAWASGWCYA